MSRRRSQPAPPGPDLRGRGVWPPPWASWFPACLAVLLQIGLASRAVAQADLLGRWVFATTNIDGATLRPVAGSPAGEIVGPLVFSEGPEALQFNGAQTFVRLASPMDTSKLPPTNLTAEAWVAVRAPTQWGGLIGCVQDNGSFERGWLLGYLNDKFSFAVSADGTLTYLAAPTAFAPNRWYHLAGTYDGALMRLYVNGQLTASSTAERGAILYAPAPYVIGAYQDDNEFYPLDGYLREVAVYARTLPAGEVLARYNAQKALFPSQVNPPPPLPQPELGPYVRFTGPDSAVVRWRTSDPQPSTVEYGETAALGSRVRDDVARLEHTVDLRGLKPKTRYLYALRLAVSGGERRTESYEFETDFNFTVAPVPEHSRLAQGDSRDDWFARVADGLLAETGITRGYCLDYDFLDARFALELARRSELNVILASDSPDTVDRARRAVLALGIYGARISVFPGPLSRLPFTKDSFNLIVSSKLLAGGPPAGNAGEVLRLLRPGAGVAWFGLPAAVPGELAAWSAIDRWLRDAATPAQATVDSIAGRRVQCSRPVPGGVGEWSHAYGDPGQTASSHDTRVVGSDLRVQWFGDPGSRGMTDRQSRNPPPLMANGRLYVQGNNRLSAQDAGNGRILWSLEIPNLRRVNLPRDCSNMCADDPSVLVAVRESCWRLDGASGELRQSYAVPSGPAFHWGFVATVGDRLYGTSVKPGSTYTNFDGGPYWYDSTGTESTAKVCSHTVFCLAKDSGEPRWAYTNGVILNSTLTLGGGRIYFVESRSSGLRDLPTGRIASADLFKNNRLVALNATNGELVWDKPITLPAAPFPLVVFLCYADERLVLLDSSSQYYLYGFTAAAGDLVWQRNHAYARTDHGRHMYHPILTAGKVIAEPRIYDLQTGAVLKSNLPERGGCSTMSAAEGAVHYINWDYDKGAVYVWDLAKDQRRELVGSRASCWLSLISGGGMVLLPASSGGCTCRFPLQTSIGFAAP